MFRPIRSTLVAGGIALVLCAAFAGGRRLRTVAAGPIYERTRLTALSGLTGALGLKGGGQGDDTDPGQTFQDVYRYMKSEYVDPIKDEPKLGHGAVRAMLASLDDPKTRFLDPAQVKAVTDQLNGTFSGIGASVAVIKQKKDRLDQRRLAVVAPAPGGPASKAGIRAGDIITHIDGKWVIAYDPRQELDRLNTQSLDEKQFRQRWRDATKRLTEGISLQKALDLLNSKDGTKLALTLERPGVTAPVKVEVSTATLTVEPVEVRDVSPRVAYLRVTQFNARAAQQIAQALEATRGRALIIDLRDNGGGPVASDKPLPPGAAALLGRLARGGPIGSLVRKGPAKEPIVLSGAGAEHRRIAVLVNKGTANVAELVASALKERAGAKLIGAPTFGDPIFQKLVPLRGGAAMTVSAGRMLTASGLEFGDKGLQPDVLVETGGPAAQDEAVERAARTLAG